MQSRKGTMVWLALILLLLMPYSMAQDLRAQDGRTEELLSSKATAEIIKTSDGILIYNLSLDERRIVRRQIANEFIINYNANNIFEKVDRYMSSYYKEAKKNTPLRYPDVILQDTLDKAGNLIVQTRKFVGSSFSKVYEPELIEKKVRRFLWLKGICFFALGINDEHRLAVSYFYLPGNEDERRDFLRHVVRFSFPEVPDLSGNKDWQEKMVLVMDRLGYDIFSVKKFDIARHDLRP